MQAPTPQPQDFPLSKGKVLLLVNFLLGLLPKLAMLVVNRDGIENAFFVCPARAF